MIKDDLLDLLYRYTQLVKNDKVSISQMSYLYDLLSYTNDSKINKDIVSSIILGDYIKKNYYKKDL